MITHVPIQDAHRLCYYTMLGNLCDAGISTRQAILDAWGNFFNGFIQAVMEDQRANKQCSELALWALCQLTTYEL